MLKQFIQREGLKTVIHLFFEENFGFLVRYLPSYTGMMLRRVYGAICFKKIGERALIWPNVYFTHSYGLEIGNYFAINYGSQIDARGGVEISDHVLIGPNVYIGSSNHHIETNGRSRIFLGHRHKPVSISSNVWIGANCVICPGVHIGQNSVVAAGSVVVKDIPEYKVFAGNPAREIKKFNDERKGIKEI